MKPETKKRLDRMIFMQRLKYGAIAGGIAVALLGFMMFMAYEEDARVDKVVSNHSVHGTVVLAKIGLGRGNSYNLSVKLDDGRTVKTISPRSAGIPFKGEQVDLTELVRRSGNKNYVVKRLISQ